ncbi:cysteine peptidase family C39 domain-containing protein [Chryseobacterium gotjawalense]|uniref:Cysteine peptidase family C39 domain-containing protein n=1 Tax=Chryseobacterium gotjawalense TaxID=3042315 RepID=A0ABY8RFF0_9FLAO|nr:cysteine peptidase family C39 domain-containing protein [Chryseobacterium sp. wdc7]WHF51918.1 cysteine peptidase family C39 domain-containing protein [Chryseobacterium sp. wdc7]
MKIKTFPFYKQPDAKDFDPTCLRIISKFYGKTNSLQEIRNLSETTRKGNILFRFKRHCIKFRI